MTILINLRLRRGCIGSIFITGIFILSGGEFLTSRTGIPGGLDFSTRVVKQHECHAVPSFFFADLYRTSQTVPFHLLPTEWRIRFILAS